MGNQMRCGLWENPPIVCEVPKWFLKGPRNTFIEHEADAKPPISSLMRVKLKTGLSWNEENNLSLRFNVLRLCPFVNMKVEVV